MFISELFLWFMIYSFFGWIYESVFCSLYMQHRSVNRGIFKGPYCPIYGVSILLVLWLLQGTSNFVIVFVVATLVCGTIEYLTSVVTEKIFKKKLWDYADEPYQLNGRIYLLGLVFFAFGISLAKYFVQPMLTYFTGKLDNGYVDALALALAVVFVLDVVTTFYEKRSGKRTINRSKKAL